MKTAIIILILLLEIGLAIGYLIREKKKGSRCIGCPYSQECQKYRDLYK